MDESHDDPFKPERLKEDDDSSVAHTSQDDASGHMPNYPNMAKQRENGGQTNGGQQKKDRDDGDSSKAESESEQRKPIHNYNNNERNGKPESEKMKGNSSAYSKVESSRGSPEIIDKNSGSVQGDNDQMGSKQIQGDRSHAWPKQLKHGSFQSGYWKDGQGISRESHEVEIGQVRASCTANEPGNTPRSYSQVTKTNIPREPFQLTQVRNT